MNYKKTLLFDFDGVIHSYTSGWKGIDVIPDKPVEGIERLIKELRKEYTIKIYSTRCSEEKGINAIREYLKKHNIVVDGISRTKEKAFLIIDDRAITFRGDCKSLVDEIKNFEVWNKIRNYSSFKMLLKLFLQSLQSILKITEADSSCRVRIVNYCDKIILLNTNFRELYDDIDIYINFEFKINNFAYYEKHNVLVVRITQIGGF